MFTPLRGRSCWLNAQFMTASSLLTRWKTMSNLYLFVSLTLKIANKQEKKKRGLRKEGRKKGSENWFISQHFLMVFLCYSLLSNRLIELWQAIKRPTVLFNLVDNNSISKLNPCDLYCGLDLYSIYSDFLLKSQKALITSSKHLTYSTDQHKFFPLRKHMTLPKCRFKSSWC